MSDRKPTDDGWEGATVHVIVEKLNGRPTVEIPRKQLEVLRKQCEPSHPRTVRR